MINPILPVWFKLVEKEETLTRASATCDLVDSVPLTNGVALRGGSLAEGTPIRHVLRCQPAEPDRCLGRRRRREVVSRVHQLVPALADLPRLEIHEDPKIPNAATIILHKHDHTMGNMIRSSVPTHAILEGMKTLMTEQAIAPRSFSPVCGIQSPPSTRNRCRDQDPDGREVESGRSAQASMSESDRDDDEYQEPVD